MYNDTKNKEQGNYTTATVFQQKIATAVSAVLGAVVKNVKNPLDRSMIGRELKNLLHGYKAEEPLKHLENETLKRELSDRIEQKKGVDGVDRSVLVHKLIARTKKDINVWNEKINTLNEEIKTLNKKKAGETDPSAMESIKVQLKESKEKLKGLERDLRDLQYAEDARNKLSYIVGAHPKIFAGVSVSALALAGYYFDLVKGILEWGKETIVTDSEKALGAARDILGNMPEETYRKLEGLARESNLTQQTFLKRGSDFIGVMAETIKQNPLLTMGFAAAGLCIIMGAIYLHSINGAKDAALKENVKKLFEDTSSVHTSTKNDQKSRSIMSYAAEYLDGFKALFPFSKETAIR